MQAYFEPCARRNSIVFFYDSEENQEQLMSKLRLESLKIINHYSLTTLQSETKKMQPFKNTIR
jgi:hypothetical protein